jgi:hypothetical protein
MLKVIMPSVAFSYCNAECRYAACHYAECRSTIMYIPFSGALYNKLQF